MRLLLVEDDVKLARAVGARAAPRGLRRRRGRDGDAALMQAAVWDYDAIVLDVMLPGRDGFEVCRALRERELLGADADAHRARRRRRPHPRARRRRRRLPGQAVRLRRAARARCARWCAARPAQRPAALEVGDLVVDPATHEVARAGARVELTAREFAVLEYLARHAGEAVTRAHAARPRLGRELRGLDERRRRVRRLPARASSSSRSAAR